MRTKLRRTFASLRNYRRNFYRRRHYPAPATIKLLQDIYPNVDWRRVHFYEGLPWFTPPVAPYVTAQALPNFYSFGGYSIYLKRFDETRAQCLADIVHEAYHVMQAMSFGGGWGVGFMRGWMVYYLAEYMRHGYRKNAFEVPAYNQEFRFLSYCLRLGIRGMISQVQPGTFDNISREAELVFPRFEYKYKGTFVELTGSFFVCVAVTLMKPVADLAVFLLGSPLLLKKAVVRQKATPYHGSGKTAEPPAQNGIRPAAQPKNVSQRTSM